MSKDLFAILDENLNVIESSDEFLSLFDACKENIVNNSAKVFSFDIKDKTIDVIHDKNYYIIVKNNSNAIVDAETGVLEIDLRNKTILKFQFEDREYLKGVSIEDIIDITKNPLGIKADFDKFKEDMNNLVYNEVNSMIYFKTSFSSDTEKLFSITPKSRDVFELKCSIRRINSYNSENENAALEGLYDTLTPAYGKEGFVQKAKELLSEKNSNYFLCLLDIDYLKSVNDSYGHLFGDDVIRIVCDKIIRLISPTDIVGRIAGDKYVFLVKTASSSDNEIKPLLRELKFSLQDVTIKQINNFQVTVTVGAVASKQAKTYEDLYELAAKALYRGKSKGRDCHVIYNPIVHGNIDTSVPLNNKNQKPVNIKYSNTQFVNVVLNALVNSLNVEKTMQELVVEIRRHFLLDRVVICDAEGKIIAQSNSNNIDAIDSFYEDCLSDEFLSKFNKENIWFNNHILPNKDKFNDCLYKHGVKSCVQMVSFDNDKFDGIISYEDHTSKRIWSLDELSFGNMLGKIISSFYRKIQVERKLTSTLYIDPITGFKNVYKFKQNLENVEFKNDQFAIAVLDIKRFSIINETIGLKNGDLVLKSVAEAIDRYDRDIVDFCRIQDDRFIVLIKYTNDVRTLERIISITQEIAIYCDSLTPNLKFTVGAYFIREGDDISSAIDKANQARKYAKTQNIQGVSLYDTALVEQLAFEKLLEDNMESALENGEFEVYLQPCYYVKTAKVCSMEALIRWNFQGKVLSPIKFIPLFERNGFINRLDFFVYETVCKTLKKYSDLGYEIPIISVNVSRRHLYEKNFLEKLNALLDKYELPRKYIGLELTESLFVDNERLMLAFVNELSNAGYRIYMDDFGVAYSTLNLLSRMHVDVIKLDKAFIDNELVNESEKIIIANIIRMSKELGINVLSEGVETDVQLQTLTKLKCDYVQGYLFAKPMPVSQVMPKYLDKRVS